jgi:hypothetical protein
MTVIVLYKVLKQKERVITVYHKVWMILNVILIIGSLVYIWVFRPHDSTLIVTSQLLAQIAMILFLINVNMYFIFLVIRKTSQRKIKISLAKFSRHFMKWHIKIALTATFIIIGHALINLMKIGPVIGYTHIKMLTGYLALTLLTVTLLAGYSRHKKATGLRKKFHRVIAMVFAVIFLIHMFILI